MLEDLLEKRFRFVWKNVLSERMLEDFSERMWKMVKRMLEDVSSRMPKVVSFDAAYCKILVALRFACKEARSVSPCRSVVERQPRLYLSLLHGTLCSWKTAIVVPRFQYTFILLFILNLHQTTVWSPTSLCDHTSEDATIILFCNYSSKLIDPPFNCQIWSVGFFILCSGHYD